MKRRTLFICAFALLAVTGLVLALRIRKPEQPHNPVYIDKLRINSQNPQPVGHNVPAE